MSIAELAGYIAAIFAGMVIGLTGGGGSILTVPIFVYVFQIQPVLATTYSLFVVGATSLVGSVEYAFKKQIDFTVTAAFAIPSFFSVFITRRFLVPAMPDPLFQYHSFSLPKNESILFFFVFVMIMAALAMIRQRNREENDAGPPRLVLLSLDGLGVGVLTGTIGAGGGFLIVPMLVLLAGLPMHRAVATSILIIAVNSIVGFLGDLHRSDLDWPLLLKFTGFSMGGIVLGVYLSRFIPPMQLKRSFGGLVLAVAVYILVKEIDTL
ncbi:sulfite exporter TauE/SafE family protein [Larkinella rosea]|uniref:Probable membrane transporter protein n=1 Tax=Larkinella rosea TaxID=2025312 RepID=A0A3P1BV83_9BACT|nr:sulfite exporter TauE/SafE family protein [Larkinella rosea]RRB05028.1 sulfite exporter TauE/SafE family protein [Larkinella rosea]